MTRCLYALISVVSIILIMFLIWALTYEAPDRRTPAPPLTKEQKARVKKAIQRHGSYTIIREGDTFTLIRGNERVGI
jgi:hypothetical protein